MKKSSLLKILKEKTKDTFLELGTSNHPRIINFNLILKEDLSNLPKLHIKCYSYNNQVENDDTKWYFFIHEGEDDYKEYVIPELNTEIYIEIVIKYYIDAFLKKNEFEKSLIELRKLKKIDLSEFRDFKLKKLNI
jgi:hypothetical protein